MSRSRHKRVFASIEVDRVALVHTGDEYPDGIREERCLDAVLDADRPEDALQAVTAILADAPWRGTQRHAVLSDRLVRYLVAERPRGVRSVSELRLALETRFEQAFDAAAADWTIAMAARPFAQFFVLCAVPRRLLEATRAALSQTGTCASIRPFLACELDRHATRAPGDCWYAAAARDCVALARIAGGECERIRVMRLGAPTPQAVADLIEQERLLAGEHAGRVPVLLSGILEGNPGSANLTRVDRAQWGAKPQSWASLYRVAMAEAWQ